MANVSFYNPKDIGGFDLGLTQVNKLLPFKTTTGVFLDAPFVKVYKGTILLKTYTIGDGLTLTGTNEDGTEKTLTLTLNGSDFSSYQKANLKCECSFFIEGDIEIIFNLLIV